MSAPQQCFITLEYMGIDCIMDLWKMYSFSVDIIYECMVSWQTLFMSEEWEFDPPIHYSKLLRKSLLFFFNNLQLSWANMLLLCNLPGFHSKISFGFNIYL